MTDRPAPAAIARGLSKAQREALMVSPARADDFASGTSRTLDALHRKGLVMRGGARWCCELSPLGYRVRAFLESTHDPA